VADEIDLLRLFRDEMPGPSTDAWARARAALAAVRAEEEPAGRRGRPGRRRLLSAGGVAAVAAAVGVLLAVLVPGSRPARSPGAAGAQRARETAYVISHVRHALASPAKTSKVGYSRTVFPHGATLTVGPAGDLTIQAGTGAGPRSVGSVTVRWYRGTARTSAFTAAGQRALDVRTTIAAGGRAAAIAVNYRDATWWRATSLVPPAPSAPAPRRCGGPGLDLGPGGWPDFIRYQLSCGGYTVSGRQRVDGITAIKLTDRNGRNALWVDPATYLPVRAVIAGWRQQIQTDFRWLAPAPARLAALGLPVPAGFRQVPPP
jgi:hypothetical protein